MLKTLEDDFARIPTLLDGPAPALAPVRERLDLMPTPQPAAVLVQEQLGLF
jgi:hypothetical protein